MRIFLDSGAYSAWANNTTVNLQDYINFIKEHEDKLEVYSNLDSIYNPEETWKNQEEMERQGLHPLPVFHAGEDMEYLDRALSYDYFAIGGVSPIGNVSRSNNFDRFFKKICPESNNFYPLKKVHGFGLASPHHIATYPWYSTDTSSWVMYGKYGIILIPRVVNGKKSYQLPPWTFAISSRSKAREREDAHFETVPDMYREVALQYIEEHGFTLGESEYRVVPPTYRCRLGESVIEKTRINKTLEIIREEGLTNSHRMRDAFNLLFFLEMEESIPKWPWQWVPTNQLV